MNCLVSGSDEAGLEMLTGLGFVAFATLAELDFIELDIENSDNFSKNEFSVSVSKIIF